MAMFDSIKDTFNKSVAAVSVKSETLVESSRVKSAISNAQKRLDAELSSLGIKFYVNWKAGNTGMELFAEDLARIQGVEQEIDTLKARLSQIKAEEDKILGSAQKPPVAAAAPVNAAPVGDVVYCSNCGKALAAGSRFCDECGTPVA